MLDPVKKWFIHLWELFQQRTEKSGCMNLMAGGLGHIDQYAA